MNIQKDLFANLQRVSDAQKALADAQADLALHVQSLTVKIEGTLYSIAVKQSNYVMAAIEVIFSAHLEDENEEFEVGSFTFEPKNVVLTLFESEQEVDWTELQKIYTAAAELIGHKD